MRVLIQFYCPVKDNPIVKQILKRKSEEIFGNISSMIGQSIEIVSENENHTEIFDLTFNTEEIVDLSKFIEIIDSVLNIIVSNFPSIKKEKILYKITKVEE